MRQHIRKCMKSILKFFLVFALVCILYNVVFRTIYVDGESMQPTLEGGDWIAICRLMQPERGDIIVTNTDNDFGLRLIKRLIAVEGDTVDIDFDAGIVYVNGQALDEPYITDCKWDKGNVSFPLTVPEGKVFVLGDNRNNSTDSRYKEVGFVDAQDIIGPVLLRTLPMPVQIMK